ncbi:class I SAM-dependent methyltransferase [Catellatospora bangladeshensis]|uniref:Cyclopropane-fatty-acyl-phospholipid synthase n=1 Tax=Catellatospora bangladeshensis TaxID=310355 RepID=A0A8J3NJR6_9ACTN|nr:cyclopropane-fatty-acyl-phospholipid synthase family protein [Catellatospora bangladeshensis]GIF81761.1 cyclopropane-fatty-acyl-phospholipid synthase [Catellatospora bangladeshensis]
MAVAKVIEGLIAGPVPVRFTAFDGSSAGPPDADVTIEIRSPRALNYLATANGGLGLARAYVSGDIEVSGDLYTALAGLDRLELDKSWSKRLRTLRDLGGIKLLNPPPRPPMEVRLHGRLHSKARDRAAIAHHYDVSNRFYEWLLGPSMAYTCAVYPDAAATLEQAQFAKHDLVARKLGLEPGMRLLDVGCGWGGMVMHAAREYGVRALGVTLSRRQAEWAAKAIAEAGLSDLAEVRFMDYRDVPVQHFDAISSIGLTEHIGRDQLPGYFRSLLVRLRPGGRLLNHCITRPSNLEPAAHRRMFINRYVFPDGELHGVGHLVSAMHDHGFEVRHEENLREHYARTLAAWSANLEEHWAESVAEVGLGRARVWRLYLAASRLGFDRNVVQLHQVLGVRLDARGHSGMPLRPTW